MGELDARLCFTLLHLALFGKWVLWLYFILYKEYYIDINFICGYENSEVNKQR